MLGHTEEVTCVAFSADGRSIAWLADGGSVVIGAGPELEVIRFADSPSFNSRLRQKFRYGIPHKDLLLEPVDDDVPGARGGASGAS